MIAFRLYLTIFEIIQQESILKFFLLIFLIKAFNFINRKDCDILPIKILHTSQSHRIGNSKCSAKMVDGWLLEKNCALGAI